MTPNIFGKRFLGNREPGWHHIGDVFTDQPTAVEAVARAKADFPFILAPAMATVETPLGSQLVRAEGKSFILRAPVDDDPEYRVTGIASDEYELVQNVDIARAVDRLTGQWPVETVGVLGKGESLFIALDAGMATVRGEDIHQYFLVNDTKDGGTSLKIAFTPVRVVCQNTLVTGLRQATVSAALTHHNGVGVDFDIRVDLVSKMQVAREFTLATFEQLAASAITGNDLAGILEYVYPMPKVPRKMEMLEGLEERDIAILGALYDEATKAQATYEYYCNYAQVRRDAAVDLFERMGQDNPEVAGTAWAAYNAVVESADFRNGPDSMYVSALFGARAQEKRRAFAAALNYVK